MRIDLFGADTDVDAPVAEITMEGEPILMEPNEDGTYKVLTKDAKSCYRMIPRAVIHLSVLATYDAEVDDEIWMKAMNNDAWERWFEKRTIETDTK